MGPYCRQNKSNVCFFFLSLSALDLIHLFMCKCVLVPNAVKKQKGKIYGKFDTLGSPS
jgi:hypothetical protein